MGKGSGNPRHELKYRLKNLRLPQLLVVMISLFEQPVNGLSLGHVAWIEVVVFNFVYRSSIKGNTGLSTAAASYGDFALNLSAFAVNLSPIVGRHSAQKRAVRKARFPDI